MNGKAYHVFSRRLYRQIGREIFATAGNTKSNTFSGASECSILSSPIRSTNTLKPNRTRPVISATNEGPNSFSSREDLLRAEDQACPRRFRGDRWVLSRLGRMCCGLSGNGLRPDSGKLGDLEEQFSADVTSVDQLMCAGSVLQRKHIDQRYADQAAINQMGDLPHRVPSSLPVDNRNGLAEASPLGFLPISLDITVCGHCEDVDQPAARPEQLQCLRQGGGPYGVQDDINALSRPVANGLARHPVSTPSSIFRGLVRYCHSPTAGFRFRRL